MHYVITCDPDELDAVLAMESFFLWNPPRLFPFLLVYLSFPAELELLPELV